ncbi:MAG: tryptophan 7-halogenase [Chthoniobacterales bacterium]|nr:tryptophan 7-halogenase [Chthoniobacterales bacterium]
MPDAIYDVAIIGGGPAGSTAATLLARAGRRVLVCEREKFPRFHIGESLLPISMKTFTRLGLHEKFEQAGFLRKYGGEMASACSDEGVKFYFKDGYRSQTESSYQVPRAQFDKVLLDHAAENGAAVREETTIKKVEFFEDRAELRIESKGSAPEKISARYVIDASGRHSVLGNHFKLKETYPHLQKISIFAHYEGVEGDEGRDGTLTRQLRAKDRWFWYVPLPDGRASIGVVLDTALYKQTKKSPEDFLAESLAEQPFLARRMTQARRVTPAYASADFSYRQSRLTGERWMLAGDAAGFIDPVFSSGVFLALLGGEQCADILDVVLDHPRKAPRLFARYEKLLRRVMKGYLRFVDAWYSKEFIEVFLYPQDVLQIPPAVNAVLGGNISGSFAIRWRMSVFYFIVWLQRYLPLCPRRTLVAPKNEPAAAESLRSAA